VRLRFGYVVKCLGMNDGVVRCAYHADSRSGTTGADKYKVKGNIHWVSVAHAFEAEVRLYDRLSGARSPRAAPPKSRFEKDCHGAARASAARGEAGGALPVRAPRLLRRRPRRQPARRAALNRAVTLRDSWSK